VKIIEVTTTPMDQVVNAATAVLKAGGLVIFPTETTYGAGVDATNPAAVKKLLEYKARREGKPLSIAVTDQLMAEQFVELTEEARRLYTRFLPGPVTVVSRSLGQVAPGVESEFGTLGVRIPDYPLVLELVKALGAPITATSANMSDGKRPYSVSDIFEHLPAKQHSLIDLVLDAGHLPPNPPSTVIDTTHSSPVVFRQGDVTLGKTQKTAQGYEKLRLKSHSEAETKQIAGKILLKNWNTIKETGLVIGLDGSLGTGKTIFSKGAAEFLGITDTLTSPTYTYYQEYPFTRHGVEGTLYHFDLWQIHHPEELARLELNKLIAPRTIWLVEWFSQVRPWLEPLLKEHRVPFSWVVLEETGQTSRTLTLLEPDA
jgi:L-threonylcarbamoyladenylate synthase